MNEARSRRPYRRNQRFAARLTQITSITFVSAFVDEASDGRLEKPRIATQQHRHTKGSYPTKVGA